MSESNNILPPELQHLTLQTNTNRKANDELGQDEFFDLMLTQLRHQDPLNPMESADFLAQIAQFGTVNGITELQSSFASVASSLQSSQALQVSSLVGHTIMIPGNVLIKNQSDPVSGSVNLTSTTDSLMLTVSDASGQTVRQINMGTQQAGLVDFTWDGLNENGDPMPSGNYLINASATINGEQVSQSTNIITKVESVTISKNGSEPLLNVADFGSVNLSEVIEVM